MNSRFLTGILKSAEVLARKLERNKIDSLVDYLNINGIHASRHQVIDFMVSKDIPVFSPAEILELNEIAATIGDFLNSLDCVVIIND